MIRLPQGLGKLLCVGAAALGGLMVLVKASSLPALAFAFILLLLAVWFAEQGHTIVQISARDRGVIVTGCDTGFGFELVHELDALGFIVFAGCLFKDGTGAKKLKENCSERVHIVQLDVTKDDQIQEALKYINEHKPRFGLWGILNNAGLNFLGETELCTMEQFSRVLDINIMGTVRITKTFLPLVIKSRGRIVNVTSVKGKLALPFNGAYSISKFGGEGFSDCLRLEMKKWDVGVSIIEPCCFGSATKAVDKERMGKDFQEMWEGMNEEAKKRYGKDYVDHFNTLVTASDAESCYNINPVISAMVHALTSPKPKTRYLIGGGSGLFDKYKLFATLSSIIPTCIMDKLLYRFGVGNFPLPKALQNQ